MQSERGHGRRAWHSPRIARADGAADNNDDDEQQATSSGAGAVVASRGQKEETMS